MMNKNPKLWNILYLILAIVVAAGVWFYVDENSDRTVSVTVTDIPIEYTNQASLTVLMPPLTSPSRASGGMWCGWTAPRSG